MPLTCLDLASMALYKYFKRAFLAYSPDSDLSKYVPSSAICTSSEWLPQPLINGEIAIYQLTGILLAKRVLILAICDDR